MHLVVVTTELAAANHASGGLASFTANIARIFKRKGHKVTIILVTTKREEILFDKEIELHNIYVEKRLWEEFDDVAAVISSVLEYDRDEIRKFMVNIYKGKLVQNKVREIQEVEKIDLIHVCHLNSLGLALDGDVPYVIRLSSYMNMWDGAELPEAKIAYGEKALSLMDRLDVYTLRKARYVVSPSNLLAEIGKQYIGIRPVVIESPFVLDRSSWDHRIYDSMINGKKYILHYGRMSYTKGTHIVARISRRLLEKYPDRLLVLAGSSNEMKWEGEKRVRAHELVMKLAGEYADRVIYVGCLVREELYPLIQHAELCLLPSRIENLSNACIEAMAMRKIVIATKGASFEQLIDDRISGFLCERDDPDSCMQAVEEAMSMDEEKRNQMLAMAAKRIEKMAPDVIYEKYLAFYKEVIQEWDRPKRDAI